VGREAWYCWSRSPDLHTAYPASTEMRRAAEGHFILISHSYKFPSKAKSEPLLLLMHLVLLIASWKACHAAC
jgi:hypothetical protein